MQTNSVTAAIAAVWTAHDNYGAALKGDTTGEGNTPACDEANRAFHRAYAAFLATKPVTPPEVAAFARAAIDFGNAMAADDYLDDALLALASLDPMGASNARS